MSTKHPCETVEANADVMSLAEMILSDCGCSTSISDRLQRRVAGRIQLHVDGLLGGQKTEPVEQGLYTILYRDNWDGGGDTSYLLARLEPNGEWYAEESGAQLMTYEGDAILRAWPITEDTAMRPDPKPVLNCWCCSTLVTFKQRADADGNCPHCGAELDVDKDLVAQQQAEQVSQQLLAEAVALLESHQKWLNKLPVPTTGATHQMMHVVGKVIDTLSGMAEANSPRRMLQESEINNEWHAHGGKITGNGTCFVIGMWQYHMLRRSIASSDQPPAVAVPDGYVLVPIKPTRAMIDSMPPVEEDGYWAMYEAAIAAAPKVATPTSALADIAAERRRQIEAEGWTPEHDDAYQEGHLADAAACYALHAHDTGASKGSIPAWWPWRNEWWKPTTARRNLVKAGALIAAEIERLDRAAQKGGEA